MGDYPNYDLTPQQLYDRGKYFYVKGDLNEAYSSFDRAYDATDDDQLKRECERYMDLCKEKIEEDEKALEEFNGYFSEGISYFNVAKSSKNTDTFRFAKYKFERARQVAPDEEHAKECDEYIDECNDWIDSILYN